MAEEDLVAVVVPVRVELEQAVADQVGGVVGPQFGIGGVRVDADAGQDARQLLHVLLGVARAHAHGVQLHDLAGVVLVDVAGGVVGVVEVAQHRRVAQRRLQQVAEAAERVRPQRVSS